MRAMVIDEFKGIEGLRLADLPVPQLADDEVLIRVQAAGISPADISLLEGRGDVATGMKLPITPGREVAGIVEQVGGAVTDVIEGDEVYAYCSDLREGGTVADYVAVQAALVARKPASMDFYHAACLPLVGTAVHEALTEELALRPGQTLLVTGVDYGEGSLASQIAACMDVRVIATTRYRDHKLTREVMFAHEVLDYRDGDFVSAVRDACPDGVDAVFDGNGGVDVARSLEVIRDGGRIAYTRDLMLVRRPEGHRAEVADPAISEGRVSVALVEGRPSAQRLVSLARLVDGHNLWLGMMEAMPLQDAGEALRRVQAGSVPGRHPGKLVVAPSIRVWRE